VKWGAVLGLTAIVALMFMYEWPKINPMRTKDKAAFTGLAVLSWLLGVVLVFFPDLPSPTKLFVTIFEPFGKMFEK
jgi:hypothetical protein